MVAFEVEDVVVLVEVELFVHLVTMDGFEQSEVVQERDESVACLVFVFVARVALEDLDVAVLSALPGFEVSC